MAALVLFAGCKKNQETNGTTLTAAIEQHKTDGSRTSLNPDDLSISWTTGDTIKVNGDAEFTLTSINGEGKGVFTHTGDYTFGENNVAVYPYAVGTTVSGNTVTMTLPAEQTATVGTFGNGANPMLATFSDPDDIMFTSLCGALCLQLKGDNIAITAIEIVGGADDKLNGTFTVADYTAAEPVLTKSGDDGNSVVRLNCTATLDATAAQKFFVVLPACTMANGFTMNVYNGDDQIFTKSSVASILIEKNKVSTMGEITIPSAPAVPTGAIGGLFSVGVDNETGDPYQVYFSQGNLQYIGSATTPYWKFADNQWDYLGTTTSQNSASQTADRDLFGWGTSGYNHGAVAYQPWSTSTNFSDYYAYGNWEYNLYDQNGQADWGYNAISNGGNTEGQWKSLTRDEWYYLFYERPTSSGIRFARANVNGVNGVILLPNAWEASTYELNNADASGADYTSNTITAADWTNVLEANGAVFLPAAGYRFGTSVQNAGSNGNYWSASYSNSDYAYGVYFFYSGSLSTNYGSRRYGQSVRLVRSAQ